MKKKEIHVYKLYWVCIFLYEFFFFLSSCCLISVDFILFFIIFIIIIIIVIIRQLKFLYYYFFFVGVGLDFFMSCLRYLLHYALYKFAWYWKQKIICAWTMTVGTNLHISATVNGGNSDNIIQTLFFFTQKNTTFLRITVDK